MQPLARRFEAALNLLNLKANSVLAIACSGGPDSMALALLAQEWGKTRKCRVVALIVDHGLRRESSSEAKQVAAWLKKRGVTPVILTWNGRKPKRNIQEAARNARYRLMSEYCHAHNIGTLLVAHHLEDQAETFLLRLARGSGVDGLAGMAPVTQMHGITLARPLLGMLKSDLTAYLARHKQPYVTDPSNENTAFERVKFRKLLPVLSEVGITADRLVKTAANMARARAHLEEETGRFLKAACTIHAAGYARLKHLSISREIGLRALSTLIMIVGGHEVKTRLVELERLYEAVQQPSFKGATLGGCVFARHKDVTLIYRELRSVAAPKALKSGETLMWDNRFEIKPSATLKGFKIGALTQAGWLWLVKHHGLKNPLPTKNILYSLPALRDRKGVIVAAPLLAFAAQGITCGVLFKTSALSS